VPRPPAQARSGELTVQQAAAHLGVVEHALYYWIRCERLAARKDPSGRWLIPWNDEVEAACRDWITHPEQFAPTGPRPLPVESARDGEISIPQAAERLGVLDEAVRYQIRVGHLPAHRTPAGRIAIPWSDRAEAALRAHLSRPTHRVPPGSAAASPHKRPRPWRTERPAGRRHRQVSRRS
jgi:hypothetical protein